MTTMNQVSEYTGGDIDSCKRSEVLDGATTFHNHAQAKWIVRSSK